VAQNLKRFEQSCPQLAAFPGGIFDQRCKQAALFRGRLLQE
jgi:hypothetical protein